MHLDDKFVDEIRYEFANDRYSKLSRGSPYYVKRLFDLIGICRYGDCEIRKSVSSICMGLNSTIFYGATISLSEVAIHTKNDGYLRDAIILYGIGYFEVDQLLRGAQIIASASARVGSNLYDMVRMELSYLSNESADRVKYFITPDIIRSPRIRIEEVFEDGWLKYHLM